ncbi:hypothetical protein BGX23_005425 [Mortierella sp. AD031]|nr:hypothetical protein BGX23_005425 [Mortierella sp. AD031]
MTSSLSPPPRKQSVSTPQRSASARYPTINTNALLAAHAPIHEHDDRHDQDIEKFFASSTQPIHPDHLNTSSNTIPLPNRTHYSRPTSIATGVYSPIDPADASWSSKASPQPCPLGHQHHLHHHNDLGLYDNSNNHGLDQDMAMAGPLLPSCSYCSSVRSNSISSIMDDAHNNNMTRDRNSTYQYFENQRRKALRDLVPSEPRHRLTFHLDECWFVHFSPSAEYLASIGLDHSIILWRDVMSPEPSIYKTLNFRRTVTHVSWSPDSKYLLINFGYDHTRPDSIYELQLVDIESGETLFTRSRQNSPNPSMTTDIAWFSDGQRFISTEDGGRFCIWNIKGDIVKEYTCNKAQSGKYIKNIPGSDNFVVLTQSMGLEVHSFEGTHARRILGAQVFSATALTVSKLGRYACVTVRDDTQMHRPAHIAMYDLKAMAYVRSFEAETFENNHFVILPTFVGPHEEILSAGSENGKLHFWDVETGDLITVLEEHSKHSGCMANNLVQPGMLASCSDDNHIIIWVTKELQNELLVEDEKWMEKQRQLARPAIDIKNGW